MWLSLNRCNSFPIDDEVVACPRLGLAGTFTVAQTISLILTRMDGIVAVVAVGKEMPLRFRILLEFVG